jgi:hypothetical protein
MNHQVQVATQTTTDKKGAMTASSAGLGSGTGTVPVGKGKKNRYQFQQRQSQNQQVQQNAAAFGSQSITQQNYQTDPNTGLSSRFRMQVGVWYSTQFCLKMHVCVCVCVTNNCLLIYYSSKLSNNILSEFKAFRNLYSEIFSFDFTPSLSVFELQEKIFVRFRRLFQCLE